jgi:HNH endonuclease
MEETIPVGKKFCECGCGELIDSISKWDKHPLRFKQHHSFRIIKTALGRKPWNYIGSGITRQGYKWISMPRHHFVGKGGRVFEHRLVIEMAYNCILLPWAIVHHRNGNRLDNRLENLEATTRREHNFIHKPRKNMSDRRCVICGSTKTRVYKHKNGFSYVSWYSNKDGWLCRNCYRNQ